jgi:GxxExxY protein
MIDRQDAKNAEKRREPGDHLDRLAYEVIGAAIEVHRQLGPGFLEAVYEEALALELSLRDIPFSRQKSVTVHYKTRVAGESRLDLLVADSLIVELKAVNALAPIHTAQVVAYLKASGIHLGLLINFNSVFLKDGIRRIVLS